MSLRATVNGEPATDLQDGYYKGTLSYQSHNLSSEFIATGTTREKFEQGFTNNITLYIKITNNNVIWAENEMQLESSPKF